MLFQILFEEVEHQSGHPRFVETRSLLHQHAVHQLAEPVFASFDRDHVSFRCGPGRRPQPNPPGWNVSQFFEQIADRHERSTAHLSAPSTGRAHESCATGSASAKCKPTPTLKHWRSQWHTSPNPDLT